MILINMQTSNTNANTIYKYEDGLNFYSMPIAYKKRLYVVKLL